MYMAETFKERIARERARFIEVWNSAQGVQEVADAFRIAYSTAAIRASKYRKQGWPLKFMTGKASDSPEQPVRAVSVRISQRDYDRLFGPGAPCWIAKPDRLRTIIGKGLDVEEAERAALGGALVPPTPPERVEPSDDASDAELAPAPSSPVAERPLPPSSELDRLAALRLDNSVPEAVYLAERARVFGDEPPGDEVLDVPKITSLF
jgi:hypothetical protein